MCGSIMSFGHPENSPPCPAPTGVALTRQLVRYTNLKRDDEVPYALIILSTSFRNLTNSVQI